MDQLFKATSTKSSCRLNSAALNVVMLGWDQAYKFHFAKSQHPWYCTWPLGTPAKCDVLSEDFLIGHHSLCDPIKWPCENAFGPKWCIRKMFMSRNNRKGTSILATYYVSIALQCVHHRCSPNCNRWQKTFRVCLERSKSLRYCSGRCMDRRQMSSQTIWGSCTSWWCGSLRPHLRDQDCDALLVVHRIRKLVTIYRTTAGPEGWEAKETRTPATYSPWGLTEWENTRCCWSKSM